MMATILRRSLWWLIGLLLLVQIALPTVLNSQATVGLDDAPGIATGPTPTPTRASNANCEDSLCG